MRCLHIASGDLWAGAEVSACELAGELARRPGVRAGAIVFNKGVLEDQLRGAGIQTWLIPERRSSLAALIGRAREAAAEFAPDVIHTHRYKEHVVGALVAAASGAAHVRSAHGLSPSLGWAGGPVGLGSLVDEALADWTGSTWIVVSQDLARRMSGLRRSIHVVPNGISPCAPEPDRAALLSAFGGVNADVFVLGFVGRLEEVKRPDRFLRMMAGLPETISGRRVVGVVVGGGSMAAGLKRLAGELRLRGRVEFLGHCDRAETLVAALDALVLSSDHEGLPMVLLEAMRSGVPVVATAVGGVPEAIGPSPWLVAPADEAGLIRAAERLLVRAEERDTWSAALVARFRQCFTISVAADRVIEIYEGIVGASGSTANGRHHQASA